MKPAPARPTLPRSAATWRGISSGPLIGQPWIGRALMSDNSNLKPAERDDHFLRRSFEVASRARAHGNHPFGAVLVDHNGNLLLEAENGYMPSHDGTAHAERLLATQACTTLRADVLAKATLYPSAQRCAMCAGAIYW